MLKFNVKENVIMKRVLSLLISVICLIVIIDFVKEFQVNRIKKELYYLFESGNFIELKKKFKELEQNSEIGGNKILIDVPFLKGKMLIKEQRFDEAIEVLEKVKAEKNLPDWLNGFIRISLARAWHGKGDKKQALQQLNDASRFSNAKQIMFWIGQTKKELDLHETDSTQQVPETFGFPADSVNDESWRLYSSDQYDKLFERDSIKELKPVQRDLVKYLIGRIKVQNWENEAAVKILESVLVKDPENESSDWIIGFSRIYLARAYFCLGNIDKAKTLLLKASKMIQLPQVTKQAKDLILRMGFADEFKSWSLLESSDLRIHYSPAFPESEKEAYLKERQNAFDYIKEVFQAALPRKIDLYVWESEEEAKKMGILRLSFARADLCSVYLRKNASIGHELTHVICRYGALEAYPNPFLMEGVAVRFDFTGEDKLERAVHHMVRLGLKEPVTIKEVWNNFWGVDSYISYPLSGSFMQFIHQKWGDKRFRDFFNKTGVKSFDKIADPEFKGIVFEFESQLGKKMNEQLICAPISK